MKNDRRTRIREEAVRLSAIFRAAGALPVETDSLLPADVLLDLYGEDIRARAFVIQDPACGEQMLRPDFTVPIVQCHMAEGAEPMRYTYCGAVWRKQTGGRATEYVQVGYEVFDRENPAAADAEVFGLFHDTLAHAGLRVATGDMGLLRDAVRALSTTEDRKTALMRHLWRPTRFVDLLERFGGRRATADAHAQLLEEVAAKGLDSLLSEAGPKIGLRSEAEIRARISALQAEQKAPALAREELAMIEDILAMSGSSADTLATLRRIATVFQALNAAADRIEARLAAIDAKGIDAGALPFEAAFGRTTLEYYDGFVFGFLAEGRPDLPVIASGGRYDALTARLGQGRSIAAVGGVIRPEALLEACGWP
ncbi:MAG: ATP phosphoribosyltransferase regulatory subunit [Rhodobacteraceae bacterium]|nr:ATP phosphoribosyltransferase regulatory subunit [Paracoccaceae bacterium]